MQRLETGFERDVNRYRWAANAFFARSLGRWDVALTNRFTSDAFLLFSDRLSFRDENRLSWQVSRPLGNAFAAQLRGRADWFSLSEVFNQEVYAGLRYAAGRYGWLEPAVGFAWDRRPGIVQPDGGVPLRMDSGPAYGLRLNLAPPPFDDYLLRLAGEATWQVINPRRGRSVRFDGGAQRDFQGTRLQAEAFVASVRRDAYQAVSFLNRDVGRRSETVEATTSDTVRVGLDVVAPLFRDFQLTGTLGFQANDRFIRTVGAPAEALFFDTNFSRLAFDGEVGVLFENERHLARLAGRLGAEEERRRLANRDALPPTQASQKAGLLQQADYDAGAFTLLAQTRATLHPRLVVTFDGVATLLRHDTPEVNLDDRDELFYNGQVGLLFRASRYLQADVKVFGSYFHTVYLAATRSAENNVQRSLRLRPTMRWTPSARTRLSLASEARATYTVDDFVLPGRRPTDQSAREMRFDGTFAHDFGGGLALRLDGSLSELQLGRLLWDRFAEIPFDTLRTYSGWLRVQAGRRVTAELGLRVFIRSDFDRAVTIFYPRADDAGNPLLGPEGQPVLDLITRPGRARIIQAGPTCTLAWPMRRASTVRLNGWLNVQHVHHRLYGALPSDDAPRIRAAAREGSRKVFPNLALSVLWNF